VSALEVLLVGAVLVGMSVQSAIGFGFAFFVAPAAFAAFDPAEAVTLVLGLAIAINCLVLFGERRSVQVARREVAILVAAAVPAMVLGAWALTRVDQSALQLAVGLVVLAGAAVQWRGAGRRPAARRPGAVPVAELGGGLAAGVLTTSVSVNGPALVLAFSHLGLRGARLRDSLAAGLLGLSLPATVIVFAFAGADGAIPTGWVLAACVPAVLIGHRFGASVFRRLDEATHHRAALVAAAIAGLLSVAAAVG
jgi:uncharacterized protein